jgi:hypothetical protein
VGKWKKVMFVFILEVLRGVEGPRPDSFWDVPKKRRRHHLPKKPKVLPSEALPKKSEVSPPEAPAASSKPEVPPPESPVASALGELPGLDEDDMMEEHVRSPFLDSFILLTPPSRPYHTPTLFEWGRWTQENQFPRSYNRNRVLNWVAEADSKGFPRVWQFERVIVLGYDSSFYSTLLIRS